MGKFMILSLAILILLNEFEGSRFEDIVLYKLNQALTFIDKNFNEFGFDGTFGVILAQVQLSKIIFHNHHLSVPPESIYTIIEILAKKCEILINKMMPLMPNEPPYMITFRNKLLNVTLWSRASLDNDFMEGEISDVGIYHNWTADMVLRQKQAIYKGTKSDKCLREILENSPLNGPCFVSDACLEMMLDWNRIDTGYLLTHRILYLQIKRLQGCTIPGDFSSTGKFVQKFCSYVFKEARTNQILGFPYHDLFLEQVMLCGMEGYKEFLNDRWLSEILNWQNPYGCFASIAENRTKISKRTSTTIRYGCSDHSTGLGTAVLALFLRKLIVTRSLNEHQ